MDSPGFEPGASRGSEQASGLPRRVGAKNSPLPSCEYDSAVAPSRASVSGDIMHGLEPISPREAVQQYLADRKPEVTQSTLYEHKCRLNRFLEWCDEERLKNMNTMTRRKAQAYKRHRVEQVAPTTVEHEMRTFRIFLKFCERVGGVPEGVAASVSVPTASKSKRSRSETLPEDRAEQILDYPERFEYASFRHVLCHIIWNLGCRTSGVRALDLEDFHENSADGPYIEFVHRPEQGTPLKNKWKSERKPPIRESLRDVIVDYIEHHRHDVTDDYGRKPLLTTEHGRPHKTTIQRNIYSMTRPCYYTDECPHNREIEECETVGHYNTASKCPSSRSPHTLGRGAATKNLNDGMPEEMASDRMVMTPEVLRDHYNAQTEDDKRELQRQFLDDI
jgi:site-specific recombinase XerD